MHTSQTGGRGGDMRRVHNLQPLITYGGISFFQNYGEKRVLHDSHLRLDEIHNDCDDDNDEEEAK